MTLGGQECQFKHEAAVHKQESEASLDQQQLCQPGSPVSAASQYDIDDLNVLPRCKPPSLSPSYASSQSTNNISTPQSDLSEDTSPACPPVATADPRINLGKHSLNRSSRQRWAGIASQPEFSPITQEQIAAEVKGIYAGLVMVEAKCMNIDAQKASQPNDELSTEQWQALVALHRTLLYEHHDFLMATQHPSANPALLGLATKYSMPARMWKHGIHAFLEVLRHRRRHSQEYMLAFIYLAYQMTSLLLETVPRFTDTWLECLGDLARYRMAIEDDREIRPVWAGVAGRWYAEAADRHPTVGRLYHHSGILERPPLRKFYLYGRALTSVQPFANAKESLNTLCKSIAEDKQALHKSSRSADALVTCFHSRCFLSQSTELIGEACSAALTMLSTQPEDGIGVIGVPLAVTNIAALLDYGSPDNVYRQLFEIALNQDILDSTPPGRVFPALHLTGNFPPLEVDRSQHPADFALDFCYHSFNSIVRRTPHEENLPSLLPYVHVMVVFFKSIHTLRSRISPNDSATNHLTAVLSPDRLDWPALANFLNLIAKYYPISSHTESFANGETLPSDGIPLLEDYMMRGLVWTQWYFSPDWFNNIEDDDGSRCLEDDNKRQQRAARVLYLGMTITPMSSHLGYDRETRQFSAVTALEVDDLGFAILPRSSMSPRTSSKELIEGGWVVVPRSPPDRGPSAHLQEEGPLDQVKFKQEGKEQSSVSKMKGQSRAGVSVEFLGPDVRNSF